MDRLASLLSFIPVAVAFSLACLPCLVTVEGESLVHGDVDKCPPPYTEKDPREGEKERRGERMREGEKERDIKGGREAL